MVRVCAHVHACMIFMIVWFQYAHSNTTWLEILDGQGMQDKPLNVLQIPNFTPDTLGLLRRLVKRDFSPQAFPVLPVKH